MNIVVIGSGNVATHLSKKLFANGHKILQIFSRNINNAIFLGKMVDCHLFTDKINEIDAAADLYIFSIKDDALPQLIEQMPKTDAQSVWIHTSGSVDMSVFEHLTPNYGVIYPVQTFSKQREVCFKELPILVEANSLFAKQMLQQLADKLSNRVIYMSSSERKFVHLSAVFACNFVNYQYTLAADILSQHNICFSILSPLIEETAKKAIDLMPQNAQTGPAVRYDNSIINKHLSLICDANVKEIYNLISVNINKRYKEE